MTPETINVGLLLCDHLDEAVQAIHGDYTDLYPNTFAQTAIKLQIYDVVNGQLPVDAHEQDAWMVSGSRFSAYEDLAWIQDLKDFIAQVIDNEVPLVGICFGHQLIAIVLGGDVQKADVGWGVGRKVFDVVHQPAWFPDDSLDTLVMYMSHQDQVLQLPPNAVRVGTSDYCPNASYVVGNNVFCVQGHPEFNPGVLSMLLRRRRERLGDDVTDEGLASLELPVDQEVIPQLIESFLTSSLR